MKTKINFRSSTLALPILFFIAFGIVSCSEESMITVNDDLKGGQMDNPHFFDKYAGEYQMMYDEDIWKMMTTQPEMVVQKLFGNNPSFASNSENWIPFAMINKEMIYSVAPHYKDGVMDGMIASAKGDGMIFIEEMGDMEIVTNTDQFHFMSGGVEGMEIIESLKFSSKNRIVDILSTSKMEDSYFDAILMNEGNSGMLDGYTGFSLRKAIMDQTGNPMSGPNATLDGIAEMVSIGYLVPIE